MAVSDNRTSRSIVPLLVIVLSVMLPILYVLSTGPATMACNRGYLPWNIMVIVYHPLDVLGRVIPPFAEWLRWYTASWE